MKTAEEHAGAMLDEIGKSYPDGVFTDIATRHLIAAMADTRRAALDIVVGVLQAELPPVTAGHVERCIRALLNPTET